MSAPKPHKKVPAAKTTVLHCEWHIAKVPLQVMQISRKEFRHVAKKLARCLVIILFSLTPSAFGTKTAIVALSAALIMFLNHCIIVFGFIYRYTEVIWHFLLLQKLPT